LRGIPITNNNGGFMWLHKLESTKYLWRITWPAMPGSFPAPPNRFQRENPWERGWRRRASPTFSYRSYTPLSLQTAELSRLKIASIMSINKSNFSDFFCGSSLGPTFGGNRDLQIISEKEKGYSKLGFSFDVPPGQRTFLVGVNTVTDYEVFGFHM